MKKMGKFLYGIMFSFFVMMLCSCGVKNKGASVSLSVDIQESLQKNDFVFSRSIVDEELLLEVCLFDVDDNYKEYKVKTVSMVDGKAKVSFDKIPEGFKGVIEAKILYEEITLYEGKSDAFTVRPGKNVINLQLNKVKIDEKSKIAGIAKFENAAEHLGINVTLVSTDGLMTTDASAARGIATNARVVKDFVTTDKDGNYLFENVAAGVYTIYASSNSSTEKAILTNVVVSEEGGTITPSVLKLTATGIIKGSVTIDGKAENTYGADILVLGTSFSASTDENGAFEISGVPAKEGYVLCFRKDGYTTIVQRDVVVNADSATDIGSKNISSAEWKEYAFTWLGAYDAAPVVAQKNQAYFNKTDGCSYIYTGTSWEMLTAAGKDGVDGAPGEKGDKGDPGEKGEKGDPGENGEAAEGEYEYSGILDLENFFPETLVLKVTQYSSGTSEINFELPYIYQLPNKGDKINLELEFVSNTDIENLGVMFADTSEAANWWLDLIDSEKNGYGYTNIKAGELIKISHTFDVVEKPIQKVALHIDATNLLGVEEIELTIKKAKIDVQTVSKKPNYVVHSKNITCVATEDGIKFTGNLLSNISGGTAVCEIQIYDTNNQITMVRNYSLSSDTWENWETIYPLVEKDKQYNFEVRVLDGATTICDEKFTVVATGGLGEYKVINSTDYELSLEDKTLLTRTPQEFTNNENLQNLLIDYGTKYVVYSNPEEATSIYDGMWCHDTIYWKQVKNQICDLTKLGWPSYSELENKLIGRKLGIETMTILKIAGYTYNNTAVFRMNDKKETFFDWDDEEPNKFFVRYRNPKTSEYFSDVPGTSLYYIVYNTKELDEYGNGNIVFVDENTEGAIPVYGKLINYGDKIYEPMYAPKIEHYTFTGDWKVYVGENSVERYLEFPFNSNDFGFGYWGRCIPIVFEPIITLLDSTAKFISEDGFEICEPIVTQNDGSGSYDWLNIELPAIPEKEGFLGKWQDESGNTYYAGDYVKLYNITCTFTAKYEVPATRTAYFYDGDGEQIEFITVTENEYNSAWNLIQLPSFSNLEIPEGYIAKWQDESGNTYYASDYVELHNITCTFTAKYELPATRTAYFYDENGEQINESITVTENEYSSWNQIRLPEIPQKDGYSHCFWYDEEGTAYNQYSDISLIESETRYTAKYIEPEIITDSDFHIGNLSNGLPVCIYKFACEENSSYTVSWVDSYEGKDALMNLLNDEGLENQICCDVKVSVYSENKTHIVCENQDSGYVNPTSFTAENSGYYFIEILPYSDDPNSRGYFAVKLN